MNVNLYRVILHVDDIESAATFYSVLFDTPGTRVSSGRHYFDCGGTILACYDPRADGDTMEAESKKHPYEFFYFSVDNLEVILDRLSKLNPRFVDSAPRDMPWGERSLYAQDPFGNPICFVQAGTEFVGKGT